MGLHHNDLPLDHGVACEPVVGHGIWALPRRRVFAHALSMRASESPGRSIVVVLDAGSREPLAEQLDRNGDRCGRAIGQDGDDILLGGAGNVARLGWPLPLHRHALATPTPSITLKVYAHVLREQVAGVADVFAAAVGEVS